MMEGRYIHWCAVESAEATTGTVSAYGQYTTLVTTASTRCTFKNGGVGKDLESGAFMEDLPSVILPATAAIVEGQTLVGVSSGWSGNYIVRAVRTVYNRFGVDHIRCDLEAV